MEKLNYLSKTEWILSKVKEFSLEGYIALDGLAAADVSGEILNTLTPEEKSKIQRNVCNDDIKQIINEMEPNERADIVLGTPIYVRSSDLADTRIEHNLKAFFTAVFEYNISTRRGVFTPIEVNVIDDFSDFPVQLELVRVPSRLDIIKNVLDNPDLTSLRASILMLGKLKAESASKFSRLKLILSPVQLSNLDKVASEVNRYAEVMKILEEE